VEVDEDAVFGLEEGDRAKRLRLSRGGLLASVASQPRGYPLRLATPHAEITVRGTRLRLGVSSDATRLEVEEGSVALVRTSDRASIEVEAGRALVATESGPLVDVPVSVVQGLVGLWTFDEAGGEVIHDFSGHGNHGAIGGATRAQGRLGGALRFDAFDQQAVIPHSDLYPADSDHTVAFWILWFGGSPEACLVNKSSDLEPISSFVFRYWPSWGKGYVAWFRFDGRWPVKHLVGRTPIDDGRWHHVAGVLDGSAMRLYLDGAEDGLMQEPTEGSLASDSAVLLGGIIKGGRQEGAKKWGVCLDELRIYDRALGPDEISALAAPAAPAGAGKGDSR
jgi:hypothetical protein